MKTFEEGSLDRVSFGGDFWRSTATADVWEDPVAYLESRGVVDAAQRQMASTRSAVECASSSSIITIVN